MLPGVIGGILGRGMPGGGGTIGGGGALKALGKWPGGRRAATPANPTIPLPGNNRYGWNTVEQSQRID